VFKVTLLPSDVAPTVQWLSETLQCLDHDVVGRAGIGVLLVRVGGSDDTQARVLNDLRVRLPVGRGSAVVVRASDALRSRVDAWGPLGEGLPLMRAIKQRFDPSGILNPGRLGL
jgi:glycolate oxidase FAD binding subunit